MTIYSYVMKRIEDGGWTGVPRFDFLLRRTLPGLQSVTSCPKDLPEGDRVITDNHLSLDVPDEIRTVVVHHGCAAVHFARDPYWRTDHTATIASLQHEMLSKPNRSYVAPSTWVAQSFAEWHEPKNYHVTIIPHFVERIPRGQVPSGRPIITGDWRDHNKGLLAIRPLQDLMSKEWDIRPLDFRTDADRIKQYSEASLYLCLSQSEGGSFSLCDAEAAELPIVTTDVGNYLEFSDCDVIDWRRRDQVDYVIEALAQKLRKGREIESFYTDYGFDEFRRRWEKAIQ